MEPRLRVQQVVATFKQQLASALEECESSLSTSTSYRSTQRSRFPCAGGLNLHRVRRNNGLTGQVRTKLSQLSSLASEVSQELRELPEKRDKSIPNNSPSTWSGVLDGNTDIPSNSLISLKGPPGSEPRNDLPSLDGSSGTRYEEEKSLVYHRNSMKATLSSFYSPSKLSGIQLKDSPKEKVEVYVDPPKEGDNGRSMRSRDKAFRSSGPYMNRTVYKESSSSDSEYSDDDSCHSGSSSSSPADAVYDPSSSRQYPVRAKKKAFLPDKMPRFPPTNTPSLETRDHLSVPEYQSNTPSQSDVATEDYSTPMIESSMPCPGTSSTAESENSGPDEEENSLAPQPDDDTLYETAMESLDDSGMGQMGSENEPNSESLLEGSAPDNDTMSEVPLLSPQEVVVNADTEVDELNSLESPLEEMANSITRGLSSGSHSPSQPSAVLHQDPSDTQVFDTGVTDSPKASGIRDILNDLQEDFPQTKQLKKKKKHSSKQVRRSGRLNSNRSSEADSSTTISIAKPKVYLSLPLEQIPVVLVRKLSQHEIKQVQQCDIEEGTQSSPTHSVHASETVEALTWNEFEEEAVPLLARQPSSELVEENSEASIPPASQSEALTIESPVDLPQPLEMEDSVITTLDQQSDAEEMNSDNSAESPTEEMDTVENDSLDTDFTQNDSDISPDFLAGHNQGIKQPQATPPPIKVKRRLFSPSVSSEDDFDMSSSQLPPFSKATPLFKSRSGTPASIKRRKILQSVSDGEDEKVEKKITLKTKEYLSKVKSEDPLNNHTDEDSLNNHTDEDSLNNHPDDDPLNNHTDQDFLDNLTREDSVVDTSNTETELKMSIPLQSPHSRVKAELTVNVSGRDETGRKRRLSKRLRNSTLVPSIVICTGCGCSIDWKTTPVHKHERLKVLVCAKCWNTITRGHFTVEDGHEVYCTLCGDGGDIVLCDFCDKSFCQSCIGRISGKDRLKDLLNSEDAEFTCYCCDPLPLESRRSTCRSMDLMNSRKSRSHIVGKKSFKSQEFVLDSGEENEASMTTPAVQENGIDSDIFPEEQDNLENKNDSKVESTPTRLSNSNSDKANTVPKKKLSLSSNKMNSLQSSESSSSETESPEVHTDDVSLSDTSAPGDQTRKKKKKTKKIDKQSRDGSSVETNSSKNELVLDSKESAPATNDDKPKNHKHRSRRQLRLEGSDFECGSEYSSDRDTTTSRKRAIKRTLSSNSSTDESLSNRQGKRSRLADVLSSGNESDDVRTSKTLTVDIPSSKSEDQPLFSLTPDKPSRPVTYLTATNKLSLSSDSSDSDIFSQKPRRKKGVRKFSSSSSHSRSVSPVIVKNKKKKKGLLDFDICSDDDFADLSRVGPRPRKKFVKRNILSESNDSMSDDASEPKKTATSDESEESEEKDSLDKSLTPGKKRRAIRKLISDAKLDNKTKLAQQREKERLDRLKRKSMSDNIETESQQLVLEEVPKTKEAKVAIRSKIVPSIKPHQKEGIKFLYDACVESLELFKSGQRNGAILAHCMGLGKTLQVIAFIDALLCCEGSEVNRVLILTPVNTLYNWMNEWEMWIPDRDYGVYVMNVTGMPARTKRLRKWFHNGGVLFMGYEMFRNLAMAKNVKKKKTREELAKFLLDPGADIIVCDEGHVMRNSKSNLALILGQVKTLCRIVLTGTPLQNNLMEYYTMVNFVKPNLLGTQSEFRNLFVNPIKNGQCSDSQPSDIRKMKQRAHILHQKVSGCVQRKDYRVLAATLPPKQEYVISFRLTDIQDKLYRLYLDQGSGYHGAKTLFSTFSNLAKVWNHPWVLKLSEMREMAKTERRGLFDSDEDDETSSLGGFIVSGSEDGSVRQGCKGKKKNRERRHGSNSSSCRSSRQPSVSNSVSRPSTPANEVITISSDSNSSLKDDDDSFLPPAFSVKLENMDSGLGCVTGGVGGMAGTTLNGGVPSTNAVGVTSSEKYTQWYSSLLTDDIENKIEVSGKLLFLVELLNEASDRQEKVIVFSQSLLTLDLIENFLGEYEHGDWTPGLDYYRLDGSTKADTRQSNMTEFNDKSNDRIRLFLISTRAGSLGVNLVAANRVVIFDACWNPSHDLQAIFRTYRYGQTKPIFVYRLLAQGTMEEKIYDRQVTKESLSMRVVDEKQIGRHYTASDLAELFTYSPKPPTSPPFKRPKEDLALCSILDKLEPLHIGGYHEHDSLLEHIYDEELTEEDRKAAWENYKQQTTAETQRYNYNALQGKIEDAQKVLGLAGAQVTGAQVTGATPNSDLSESYRPYQNTLVSIDSCINYYAAIIQKRKEIKVTEQQMPSQQVQFIISSLLSQIKHMEQTAKRLLDAANSSIQRFNTSKLSQNPDLNRIIRDKCVLLQSLYVQVMNGAVLPTLPAQASLAARLAQGQGSSSRTESTVEVSSTTQ